MSSSAIEWTEHTWNPVVGCTKVSPGCKHCYAEVMARRLRAIGVKGYERGFTNVNVRPERLDEPLKRKRSTMYFVNSMSDLFHPHIPTQFVHDVFDVMAAAPRHIFQVLTKRPEHMMRILRDRMLPDHIWLGVSVEDRRYGVPRIGILKQINSNVRFLSIEPLLEDIGRLDLSGIHWVIVGGESGHKARPMKSEWAISIKRQCIEQDVDFFFKQWGAWGEDGQKRSKKKNGRLLQGKVWNGMPSTA